MERKFAESLDSNQEVRKDVADLTSRVESESREWKKGHPRSGFHCLEFDRPCDQGREIHG